MTKTGTEKPRTANSITKRSVHPPAFQAASTPIGIATLTAKSSVTIESEMVASSRWPIRVATGRFEKIDVPRSPWRIAHSHVPKRTWYGRSRPSERRMRAMSSAVDMSPAMIAAGSPGEK
jgi:hypothetical protein